MGNSSGHLGSGSTAEEVMSSAIAAGADLTGKIAIVTGGNTGIGLETARVLAANKCTVIIACRNAKKASKAIDKIKKSLGPTAAVEAVDLDLADTASIRRFVGEFHQKKYPGLHILINNAGIMNTSYGKTKDGFEQQFGVNVLGHFLLTYLLIPTMKQSAPARIVNVSSVAHKMFPYTIETIYSDFNMERNYTGWESYSRSKLGNIILSNCLDRRLSSFGIRSFSLHPGVIRTSLWQHSIAESIFITLGRPFLKSVAQGAATTMFCAVHPSLDPDGGGKYYDDCKEATPIGKATNQKLQDDFWDICLKQLGLEPLDEAESTITNNASSSSSVIDSS